MGASHFLELDGPSCVALWVASSMDVLPCGFSKGCHLFSHGDHLGTGVGEAAAGSCSSTVGVLVCRADGGDRGDCLKKMW